MDYILAKKLNSRNVLRLIALTYARAKSETLMQVLEFLAKAREKGLSIEQAETIVANWLTEVDAVYRDIICSEELFKFAVGIVEIKAKAQTKAKN